MRGFVLLVMLVYLQIFSLLAIQAMAVVGDHKKIIFHGMTVAESRRQAQLLLRSLDNRQLLSCQINRRTSAQLTTSNLGWWRHNACRGVSNGREYFYLREDLGVDACAAMESVDKQEVAVRYYRDTLLYLSPLSYYQSAMVQSTIAVAADEAVRCGEEIKRISPGRQMMRWLW